MLRDDEAPAHPECTKSDHETGSEGVQEPSCQEQIDLMAVGPDIIFTGELLNVDPTGWALEVKDFVSGDLSSLVGFIGRFSELPPGDRYVLVNALGDGRVLADAPSVTRCEEDYVVRCPVARVFPRIEAKQLPGQ